MNHLREIVRDAIQKSNLELLELSQRIHTSPELSNAEFKAHDWLCDYLETKGFEVTRSAYGIPTAFMAMTGSTDDKSPTIAFLSEYDALPEIGHACGHNLIAILGVAAALASKAANAQSRPFRIKLLGTPAEETTGGKINLLEAGAFKDVDIALMAHPGPENVVHGNWLALQGLRVEFKGKAAHASAAPWEGINALDAAVSAYTNISHLRQQILPTDRVHGIIRKGGDAPNIIPDHTVMEYYLRSKTLSQLNTLKSKVQACFQAAALSSRCTLVTDLEPVFANVKSNRVLGSLFQSEMELQGVSFSEDKDELPRGSTDMGNVTFAVPGIHPLFCLSKTSNLLFSYHTKDFQVLAGTKEAHECAMQCAQALAMTALRCVQEPENLEKAKKEFEIV